MQDWELKENFEKVKSKIDLRPGILGIFFLLVVQFACCISPRLDTIEKKLDTVIERQK